MRAAVVQEVNQLVVQDVPSPEAGAYQALCEILFGAVCTGTDLHLLKGDPPLCNWVQKPFILGHESIGRVVEVGPKVSNLKAGDLVTRVMCPAVGEVNSGWGGYAEYGIAHDWQAMQADGLEEGVWKKHTVNQLLPAGTDPAAATMFTTWRETLSYITRLGVKAGSRVLVIGSGGNGLSYAAHACNLGAASVVLVGSARRQPEAERLGVHGFVDYKAPDASAQLKALAPEGFTHVVDAIGRTETGNLALGVLADGGVIGVYGLDGAGRVELDPDGGMGSYTVYSDGYDEGETHAEVLAAYGAGTLDASVWLDLEHPFALEDINDAFDAVRARTQVKPLIRMRG